MNEHQDYNEYNEYMDSIKADSALQSKLLSRMHVRRVRMTPVYAFAACAALIIGIGTVGIFGGFERLAGVFSGGGGVNNNGGGGGVNNNGGGDLGELRASVIESELRNENSIVLMRAVSISPSEITFQFENKTDLEFMYGSAYSLHVRNERGEWRSLNPYMSFTSEGYPILPNSTTKPKTVSFERFANSGDGELPMGEYLFEKSLTFRDSSGDLNIQDVIINFIVYREQADKFTPPRSFVPTNQPTGVAGCNAPSFCMCEACKGTPPTNLSVSRLNSIRDGVYTWLSSDKYDFPLQSGYVQEWGELNRRIVFEFARDNEEMHELRPQIEEAIWFYLGTRSDFTVASLPMETFALIGWGDPVLVPYGAIREHGEGFPVLHINDFTSTGLTYNWTNDSNREFTYGEGYELFVREGDYWRSLNHNTIFHMIGYHIPRNGKTDVREANWGYVRGELPAGEYRLVKSYTIWEGNSLESRDAEVRFTIK